MQGSRQHLTNSKRRQHPRCRLTPLSLPRTPPHAESRHLRQRPHLKRRDIISKEDQEKACRDYCLARGLTVSAAFTDNAGARDEFTRMISEATRDGSPLDFVVVWKLHRFSMSLEETIELRDKLRRAGTRLVSTTEKGVDD